MSVADSYIHQLPPMVAPEPNVYGVPTRYPFQVGEYIFWNEDGHLRGRPADQPASFYSSSSAVELLFKALAAGSRGPNSLPPLTQAMIDAAGAALWDHASPDKEQLIRSAYCAMDDAHTRTTATNSLPKEGP